MSSAGNPTAKLNGQAASPEAETDREETKSNQVKVGDQEYEALRAVFPPVFPSGGGYYPPRR